MHFLDVTNVNEAYVRGRAMILSQGVRQTSRVGEVFTLEKPLAITYQKPRQRVLFDPGRDANPFFHLFESLWLLAGRNDARWLDRFVGDFSERFAEPDGRLHGSYGFRWRDHFDLDWGGGGGGSNTPDQLDTAVRLLKADPLDRRVVIQMWDPVADLGQARRDVPCNLTVVPRIREVAREMAGPSITRPVLDITVFNRSNDFIWGTVGANAVQFSVLQEYLAGRIGVGVGTYTQVSTNAHIYGDVARTLPVPKPLGNYPGTCSMGQNWDEWDKDLTTFMMWAEDWHQQPPTYPNNPWFEDTAQPMFAAHATWKEGIRIDALDILKDPVFDIAPDWKQAAIAWMERRLERMAQKKSEDLRPEFQRGV